MVSKSFSSGLTFLGFKTLITRVILCFQPSSQHLESSWRVPQCPGDGSAGRGLRLAELGKGQRLLPDLVPQVLDLQVLPRGAPTLNSGFLGGSGL